MELAFALVVVGAFVAWQRLVPVEPSAAPAPEDFGAALPYKSRERLLTGPERALYDALLAAAADHYRVFAKVRLSDVVCLPQHVEHRWAHWSRIAQKQVDFLLCDRVALAPLLVLEIERPANAPHADERDEFVAAALAAAGVPMLRVPSRNLYAPEQLAKAMRERFVAAPVSESSSLLGQIADSAVPSDTWVWGTTAPAPQAAANASRA